MSDKHILYGVEIADDEALKETILYSNSDDIFDEKDYDILLNKFGDANDVVDFLNELDGEFLEFKNLRVDSEIFNNGLAEYRFRRTFKTIENNLKNNGFDVTKNKIIKYSSFSLLNNYRYISYLAKKKLSYYEYFDYIYDYFISDRSIETLCICLKMFLKYGPHNLELVGENFFALLNSLYTLAFHLKGDKVIEDFNKLKDLYFKDKLLKKAESVEFYKYMNDEYMTKINELFYSGYAKVCEYAYAALDKDVKDKKLFNNVMEGPAGNYFKSSIKLDKSNILSILANNDPLTKNDVLKTLLDVETSDLSLIEKYLLNKLMAFEPNFIKFKTVNKECYEYVVENILRDDDNIFKYFMIRDILTYYNNDKVIEFNQNNHFIYTTLKILSKRIDKDYCSELLRLIPDILVGTNPKVLLYDFVIYLAYCLLTYSEKIDFEKRKLDTSLFDRIYDFVLNSRHCLNSLKYLNSIENEYVDELLHLKLDVVNTFKLKMLASLILTIDETETQAELETIIEEILGTKDIFKYYGEDLYEDIDFNLEIYENNFKINNNSFMVLKSACMYLMNYLNGDINNLLTSSFISVFISDMQYITSSLVYATKLNYQSYKADLSDKFMRKCESALNSLLKNEDNWYEFTDTDLADKLDYLVHASDSYFVYKNLDQRLIFRFRNGSARELVLDLLKTYYLYNHTLIDTYTSKQIEALVAEFILVSNNLLRRREQDEIIAKCNLLEKEISHRNEKLQFEDERQEYENRISSLIEKLDLDDVNDLKDDLNDVKNEFEHLNTNYNNLYKDYLKLQDELKEKELVITELNKSDDELHKLQEQMFLVDYEGEETDSAIDYSDQLKELITKKRIVLISQNENLNKRIKAKYSDLIIIANETLELVNLINNSDYVFINWQFIGHSLYYKVMSILRKFNLNYEYLHGSNISNLEKQICESLEA